MAPAKHEEHTDRSADPEKGSTSSTPSRDVRMGETGPYTSKWARMGIALDSFKIRTEADEQRQLSESLKPRHLAMIALGAGLGAGLFVASGGALAQGVSPRDERMSGFKAQGTHRDLLRYFCLLLSSAL
jgi:yeast amino acid transporter